MTDKKEIFLNHLTATMTLANFLTLYMLSALQVLGLLLTAREEEIPSIVNSLSGSVAVIVQQKCLQLSGNWNHSVYIKRATQELKNLKEKQEAQIASQTERHTEMLQTSLQASYDAVIRHSNVLADREKAALAKLYKTFKKELRVGYSAAAAKVTAAKAAQDGALRFATKKCQAGSDTDKNVREVLLTCFADLDGSGDSNGPSPVDVEGVEAAKKCIFELLAASFERREEAQKQRQAIRLEHIEQHRQAMQMYATEILRLAVRLCY